MVLHRGHAHASVPRTPRGATMARMCTSETPRVPPLGVIGIFSHEPRRRHRDGIRATWLPQLPAAVEARFVLRGMEPANPQALYNESAAHDDVLFLAARSSMSATVGPLQTLLLWLECASRLFPETPFIGKADDDVWIRVEGLEPLLSAGRVLLAPDQSVYIGRLESYYWNTVPNNEGATGFSFGYRRCSTIPESGPFSFAKGALFFVSSNLSQAVRALAQRTGEVARFVQNDTSRCYRGSVAMRSSRTLRNGTVVGGPCKGANVAVLSPVEDVWLGHAISLVPLTTTTLDLQTALFSVNPWGFWARESLLVWHSNIDNDFLRRATALSRWTANSSRPTRCSDWALETVCSSAREQAAHWASSPSSRSCAHHPLRRCELRPAKACATGKVDLFPQLLSLNTPEASSAKARKEHERLHVASHHLHHRGQADLADMHGKQIRLKGKPGTSHHVHHYNQSDLAHTYEK